MDRGGEREGEGDRHGEDSRRRRPGAHRGRRVGRDVEGFGEPIRFGVHGGIKAFYKIEPDEDVPATLDYIVGAVGG